MDELTEEEKRAIRGSKFGPLPLPSKNPNNIRLAHPGGPVTTNKAAALAKFLERKLQEPNGLASINPEVLEIAVKNAKATVNASGSVQSGRIVRHVDSFPDTECVSDDEEDERIMLKKQKKKQKKMMKKKNKNKGKKKKHKYSDEPAEPIGKKRKVKL